MCRLTMATASFDYYYLARLWQVSFQLFSAAALLSPTYFNANYWGSIEHPELLRTSNKDDTAP